MTVFSRIRRFAMIAIVGGATLGVAGACSEPAPPPAPAAPVAKTAAERVALYQQCWQQFNDKAWDQFQNCYTETAVSDQIDAMPATLSGRAAIIQADKDAATAFPDRRGELQLVLANGDRVLGVALWTATNTGDLPPGPDGKPVKATGKAIGFPMVHTAELDSTGSAVVRDAAYFDQGTMMSQLGLNPKPGRPVAKATGAPAMVVMAKNDDAEKANLTSTQSLFDALNKHDLKGMEAFMADDYKAMTVAEAKDQNRKEAIAGTKDMFTAFPDVKIMPVTTWAAGDYVVIAGTFDGTNTGDTPTMKKSGNKVSAHFLEILKFSGGKVQDDWLFYNGAVMAAQLSAKK